MLITQPINPDVFLEAAELIKTGGWYAGADRGYFFTDGSHMTVDEVNHGNELQYDRAEACHCVFTALDRVYWTTFVENKPMDWLRENPKTAYLRFYAEANELKIVEGQFGANIVGVIVKDNDAAPNGEVIVQRLMTAYEKAKAISA